tara:strand:+ start:2717 stop:3622 length:906 start_codon:yes stop_codon:yes gene_type:complete
MVLRVGLDCSGLDAPIQALKKLKIPFKHMWSADIDPNCIKQIKANFKPQILFGDPDGPFKNGDITQRDNSKLPDIDLYCCGFPCQPFSNVGKRLGLKDARGNVFFSCIDVIKKKKPKMFVLENVKGLLSNDKGRTWEIIWGEILKLQKLGYSVDWKVLNTKDYGLPQSRSRVYIIGKRNKSIIWPQKCKMRDIKTFVDYSDKKRFNTTEKLQRYIAKFPKSTFLNMEYHNYDVKQNSNYTHCIAKNTMLWNCYMKRWANTNELSKLQGIKINNVVSKTQFKYQIGNSMSVDVLVKLLKCNV